MVSRHVALPVHAKGLYVNGGTLALFGARFHRTWLRLASRVQPGDTSVHVQHRVNWLVGQQIVLTTSALKDARDWHRNEIATVSGWFMSGSTAVVAPAPSSPAAHLAVAAE